MNNAAAEAVISIIPPSIVLLIVSALAHFLYKTLKFLIERSYQEMIDNNDKIQQRLNLINEKLNIIERDSYEIRMQLNSYITIEKHFTTTKKINKDINNVKKRI